MPVTACGRAEGQVGCGHVRPAFTAGRGGGDAGISPFGKWRETTLHMGDLGRSGMPLGMTSADTRHFRR